MKDQEIVELFFERSEQAITELILKYGAAVRNVASNILRNPQDMEECQSDTYLQVWNRIPPTRPNHLSAYVCRIARNVCLKRYHANTAEKRNSHYDVALEELEATIPALSTVESDYDAKELTQYLNSFLKELGKEDRYLFMRRYWFGDGVSEIKKVEFDGLVYGQGGTVLEDDDNWWFTVSGCTGDVGDTLIARYYDWDDQLVGTIEFIKK